MVSAATIPGNFAVEEGQKLAGVRVIPLVIQEEKIIQVEDICRKADRHLVSHLQKTVCRDNNYRQ